MRNLLVLLLLAPFALLAQVPDYVPTDGLVAYWPLDGHILDATGNHDGTNSGAVAIEDQSGIADQAMALPAGNDFFDPSETEALFESTTEPEDRIGGALQMDGVDDYASFTLPAGWGESSFSLSFSCTLEDFGSTDVDGYHYLFGHALTSQNGDIGFKAQTVPDAQQVIWAFSDDDGDGALSLLSDQVIEPDTWHAFTLVFDRDSALAAVFVDGVPTGEATIPATMGNLESGQPVGLGAFVYPPGGNLQHFHQGAFADVHFFPAALTEAEIHSLVQECTPPDIPGAAHWGVNGDQYVNLTTQEPATVVGGTIINDITPCPIPGTTDPEEEENQALEFLGVDVTPFSESGVMEVPYDAALDRTGADPFTIAADVLLEDEDWFNLFHTGQDSDPENNITFRLSPSEINLFWENAGVNYELNGALASQQLGPLATGQWHHIAASWDGSTLVLFVNGLEIATDSPSNGGPGETADRSFYWGSKHGENSLHGQLDNAQFWTVGLSQSDIIGYMGCPPVGNEPGLEGYWTFDGPDADFAMDITGNGHDGSTLGLSRVTSTRPACSPGTADLFGCTDFTACNYDDGALFSDGSCVYGCQFCGENTMWDSLLLQCVSPAPSVDTVFISLEVPIPSCGTGTVWDPVAQECIVAIPTDTDFDGCVAAGDLLNLLGTFGSCPPIPEWPDTPSDTTGTSWMCGDPLPYQGYDYATVQIGDQCWFAESLRSMQSLDGADLEEGNPGNWPDFQDGTGAWMYPDNDPDLSAYGLLYNWHATAQGDGMCPSGWHLPSDEEWKDLEVQLGIDAGEFDSFGWHGTMQGTELKDSVGWNGTDTHGFGVLPSGGVHADQGHATSLGSEVWFWSSTTLPSNDGKAMFRSLSSGESRINRHHTFKNHGASVRCLKD